MGTVIASAVISAVLAHGAAAQSPQGEAPSPCRLEYESVLFNPQDLAAARRYVDCLVRNDRTEQAIAELERILLLYPQTPELELRLAQLYLELDSYEAAQARAETVLESPEATARQQRQARRIATLSQTGGDRQIAFGSLFFGISGQTNASRGPDDDIVNLAGQQILLDDEIREQSDLTAFGLLRGGYRYEFGDTGDRLELNAVGFGETYLDLDDLNTLYGSLDAGPRFDLRGQGLGAISLRPFVGGRHMRIGGEANFSAYRAGLNYRKQLERELFRDVTLQVEQRAFNDSDAFPANSNRDGQVYTLSYELRDPRPNPVGWQLSGAYEYADLDRGFESYHALSVGAGVDYRFRQGLLLRQGPETVYLRGSLEGRLYRDPDPLIDPDDEQRTYDTRIAAGHEIRFTRWSWASVEIGYEKNFSNYEIDEYDNAYVQVGIGFNWN